MPPQFKRLIRVGRISALPYLEKLLTYRQIRKVNYCLTDGALLYYISIAMSELEGLLQIRIDAKSAVPAYEQIKRAVKLAILSGRLKDGERLMTLREMAVKLVVNPNTIIKVYGQLENEGFLYSRPGAGYYVRIDPAKFSQSNHELFREVTQDYISKALQLGCSAEQMLREVAALTNVGIPAARRKDHGND